MKKTFINFGTTFLFMFLLVSFIILKKEIFLVANLSFSANLLIYPFTYLIIAKIYDKHTIKTAKNSIYISFVCLLLFYLIISIINTIDGITSSTLVSNSLKEVFTPNYLIIGDYYFYYPDLFFLITYAVIFFITHYIFVISYDAIGGNTNYSIGFILSLLLSFILDQLLFIPLTSLPAIINETLSYKELIEHMTASFIVGIGLSLVLLILFLIIKKRN